MIQKRHIQIFIGSVVAFIITILMYNVLDKSDAVFSALVVAVFTGIGILFGGNRKKH